MDWTDEGFVLGARKFGEADLIVSLLTRAHGRHAGLVKGGAGRRARGTYQTGNLVAAAWRARLAEHLGNYRCELARAHAAGLLSERLPLLALSSAATLIDATLPEREPHAEIFSGFAALLDALPGEGWGTAYGRFERDLLGVLGFGLDLSACAVTGARGGLAFVSPNSGRAVSAEAGAPYRDRLLPLPAFLLDETVSAPSGDILAGLKLTGHFLERHALLPESPGLPNARHQLVDALARAPTISGVPVDRE